MGTYSTLERYHDAGDDANVNNVERFGEPIHSLFTEMKLLSLHAHIDIIDAAENIAYQAESKIISLHDRTYVTDASGRDVCSIERKVFSIHARHLVTMADGKSFELSAELLHVIDDIIDIDGLGWKLKGNFLGLNYELYDENDRIIAVVGQKMISMHNKYCMDIYQPEYEDYAVAILITFEHMILDRKEAKEV